MGGESPLSFPTAVQVPKEGKQLLNVNKILPNAQISIKLLSTETQKLFMEYLIKTLSVFHKHICKAGEGMTQGSFLRLNLLPEHSLSRANAPH